MFWRTHVEEVDTPAGTIGAETTTVVDQPSWVPWVGTINLWIGMAALAITSLLGLRLGFQLSNANPRTSFVDFIYDLTGALTQPFGGILSIRHLHNGGIFEPATVVAGGVYLAAAALLMLVLWGLASSTAKSVYTSTHRTDLVHGH